MQTDISKAAQNLLLRLGDTMSIIARLDAMPYDTAFELIAKAARKKDLSTLQRLLNVHESLLGVRETAGREAARDALTVEIDYREHALLTA